MGECFKGLLYGTFFPASSTNRDMLGSINCPYTEEDNLIWVKLDDLWDCVCNDNAIDVANYVVQYYQSQNSDIVKSYIIRKIIEKGSCQLLRIVISQFYDNPKIVLDRDLIYLFTACARYDDCPEVLDYLLETVKYPIDGISFLMLSSKKMIYTCVSKDNVSILKYLISRWKINLIAMDHDYPTKTGYGELILKLIKENNVIDLFWIHKYDSRKCFEYLLKNQIIRYDDNFHYSFKQSIMDYGETRFRLYVKIIFRYASEGYIPDFQTRINSYYSWMPKEFIAKQCIKYGYKTPINKEFLGVALFGFFLLIIC
jgi:hypothetical protein